MRRGKKAALKTPSAACAAGCREKPTWRLSLTIACSRWFVPIITLRESVSTTKPQQRFSAMICCTSDVNPPTRFRGYDGPRQPLRSHLRTGIFEGEYEGHERIWLLLLLKLRALRDLRDEKNDIAKCI